MKKVSFENYGLKNTPNRTLIYEALAKEHYPVTAESLYLALSSEGIDLSTVYRNLNAFVKAGIVRKEVNRKKENVFSIEKEEDVHVLVCTSCHRRLPLSFCPYHEVNEKIFKDTGFLVQDQNIEIYGLCPDCLKKQGK